MTGRDPGVGTERQDDEDERANVATFRMSTKIGAPLEHCFDLARSIDLHLESMARSRERAVAGVTSGLIGLGEEVTWEARHLGRTWRMTSVIAEFEPPRRFVDEMVRGPFVRFRHEHRFEAVPLGTLMTDLVEFDLPVGMLVNLPAALYLRRLLAVRNALIRSKAERT